MLSNCCEKIRKKYNESIGQVKKLVPTQSEKQQHVPQYRNLQLYLILGFKLKKVHSALQFNQSAWL